MRRETDVNEHRTAFRQHKGNTGSLRVLPNVLDEYEVEPVEQDAASSQTLDVTSLLTGEMTVGARTSTGEPAVIKIPHAFLGALVVVVLALISGGYWLVSTLARLEANTATIMRQQERTFTHLETQKAYIDHETGLVKFMTGLLNRDQQTAVNEYLKTNPRPPLPNTSTARPEWMKENNHQ